MADKDFGVKRINLVGAAGTPTITSPTDLIINANKVAISTNVTVGGSLGIGTTNPTSKLWVNGDGYFVGVVTANEFSGKLNATSALAQSVGFATTASNLAGGSAGNVPYQSAPNTTAFVANGDPGQVLISNGSGTPSWGNVSAASGSFGGITVQDEGSQVGTGSSITTLNFVGSNIQATATTGANGIATIRISDNLVGSGLSISGISTLGTVKISSGIITSNTVGVSVTYYGDFIGTASSAGYATTAFSLNGTAEGDLNVAYASTAGYATTAFNLNGTAEGDLNVAYASTAGIASAVNQNSVGLGTHTYGDYVRDITGTANEITVTGGTGEGSTPTLSLPNLFTVPQDLKVIRDVQIDRNLNVNGNITIGGTSAYILVDTFRVSDPDIILGFRTDAFDNDVSNDTTASHGGIAVASTEGTPLVSLNIAGIETLPATYKKIMWFKAGEFAGLGTDAWLFNYAVGIGSTQFPSGTRLAAGSVQFTENDLAVVRNINSTGIITATKFVGSVGFATTATNLADGAQGSLPYQNASGITSFLSSGGNNQVLLYDTGNNKPYWGDVSSGSGSFSGITVRDEGTTSLSNIVTVDIFGSNITATSSGAGIASIRVSDNLVGSGLSISGISTLGTVKISSGIITSNTVGVSVTYYGDFIGTASSAGYATTAFNLDATAASNLNVAYASSAGITTNLKGGAAGNVPYQSAPNTTAFVANGDPGQVLISNGSGTPSWGNVSAASGSFGGITVKDENDLVGTSGSITTLNFVGSNLRVTGTTGANGIATITMSDNLVGSGLSISGISTFGTINNGVVIKTENGVGIITSSNPGFATVTYYGDGSKLTGIAAASATNVVLTEDTSTTITNIVFSQTPNQNPTSSLKSNPSLIFNAATSSLGIGTTNPTSKLTVQGDVFVSGFSTFKNGLEVTDLLVLKPGQEGSNLFEILDDAQDIVVAVTTTGNLGIGTTNPNQKLWVGGDGYFTGVVTATKFYGEIDATSALSQSVGFATTSRDVIGGIASVTSLTVSGNSTISGFATFSSGLEVTDLLVLKPGQEGSNLFEILDDAQDIVVAVTTTGNLGIGTTTPNQKLWVNGNGYFVGVVTAKEFYGDGSKLTGLIAGLAINSSSASTAQYIGFLTSNSGTTTSILASSNLVYIPSSGNLGVGSTNPTSKLTVQGDVLISGVTTSGITRISSSTVSPNASRPVATLESVGSGSDYDIAIVPKGTGAIVASIPDDTATGGNKRGDKAVDLQLSRSSATQVASNHFAVITGGGNNTANGQYTFVGGGYGNITGANSYSAIVGGSNNTTSGGGLSFIGGGNNNTSQTDYVVIGGGNVNTVSGQYSSVLGGSNNKAESTYCSVLGGYYNYAKKNYSSVIGGYGANTRNTYGVVAFAGANTSFGTGEGAGKQQARFAILSKETTNATPSTLTANGASYDGDNVLDIPGSTAYLVKGSVIAYALYAGTGDTRAWEFTTVIKRQYGSPSLVGTPIINDIAYDSGASGWNLSITADSATSSLKVEVTGQASTTIRWVTKIDSTEVAF